MIVGVVLPKLKIKSLGVDSLPSIPGERQIKIVVIDPTIPLNQQEKCDCILHKIHDYFIEELNITNIDRVLKEINHFCDQASELDIPLLDPWDTVKHMTIRSEIAAIVRECNFVMKGIEVRSPSLLEVTQEYTDDEFLLLMAKNDIKFPFLVKPIGGILPKFRYEMSLHFCKDSPGFKNITDQFKMYIPCTIQQFYNHGGVLYKLFIIGDEWYVVSRPSIIDMGLNLKNPIHFKSSSISKNLSTCTITSSLDASKVPCGPSAGLDVDLIDELVKRLHVQMKFSLIGIDIVIDKATCSYNMIDINYLPGYKGVPDLGSKLTKLFLQYAK